MLVYAGLWGHCDKNGTFKWEPRQLKLDILPFLPFSMDQALEILEGAGFVRKFEASGKHYGNIPTFLEHQRLTGSEVTDPAKYPEYSEACEKGSIGETTGKQRGNTSEHLGDQEGKGREGSSNAPCASSNRTPPASRKVTWSESGFEIPDSVKAGFVKAFPAVAVESEIAKAHAWALANPSKRKAEWGRFLNNWLANAKPAPKPENPFKGVAGFSA